MKREAFHQLLLMIDWLLQNTNLKSPRGVSAAEKLLIFLFIISHGIQCMLEMEEHAAACRVLSYIATSSRPYEGIA